MRAIFNREMRSFFQSFRGYLFLGLFAFLTGLFVTVFNFIYGYGDFETVLNFLTVGVAVLMPFLSVMLFDDTRREDRARLYRTLPLSVNDVILGKYLTGVVILGILTVILAICPVILGMYATVNYLSAYVAIFGFFMIEHTVFSICFFLSHLFKNRLAVWLISFGTVLAMTAIRYVSALLRGILRSVLEYLSVLGTYSPFVLGLIDLRTVVFYALVSIVFIFLTVWRANLRDRQ